MIENKEYTKDNIQLRNQGVQTPGPPAFPKVRKFTPKERSAASEAQSRAAREANRSKAWLESSFCRARNEFETTLNRKFGMISGPKERLIKSSKVHVALSACLNGEAVRHNAGHCFAPFIVDDMGEFLTFESVCPEVEGLGLGTPRETIRLVNTSGDLEDWGNTTLIGTKSCNNYTSMMASYTSSRLQDLDNAGINGYILKALSPSCGLRGIPVYPTVDTRGRGSGKAQAGMFAKALMELWPELPVEDEGRLADVSLRHSFYTRVEAHCQWRRIMQKRIVACDEGQPYKPLLTFHKNHILLADSHNPAFVPALENLAKEAILKKDFNIINKDRDNIEIDNLYHRYYNTFFMALKRTGGRASAARCLRHCLAILEGKDDKKELPSRNESETAAEGEARREKDLDNGSMLGTLLEYDDTTCEVSQEKEDILKLGNSISKLEKPKVEKSTVISLEEPVKEISSFVKRECVIDAEDAKEIADCIQDFYNALVPLSMPLNCVQRQIKRLIRDRKKHEAISQEIDCDMGEYRGARALNLLENQAFLEPHQCKRVLSTIRQNKFGQTFEASHVFTCL